MRILIYTCNYYPEPIGIAPLVTELAEGLAQRGHRVRVVTSLPNYPERRIYPPYRRRWFTREVRNGVLVQRSYAWVRPQPSALSRLLFEISFLLSSLGHVLMGERPDVIFLTVPPLIASLAVMLLSKVYRCPVILNLQDILSEAVAQLALLPQAWMVHPLKKLENLAYHAATVVSVITEGFAETLQARGVPAQKLVCIPNWVDTRFIHPLPRQATTFRRLHQLEGKFVALYAGNIALTQGIETLLEAACLLQNVPDILILIVAEQRARHRIAAYCRQRHIRNVRLLPFQSRENLPVLLSAANVGLVLQKRQVVSFNLPSKTQTLLAGGLPVIASVPLDGIAAQTIRRSGAGVIVPPEQPDLLADALHQLMLNPAQVQVLSRQGRAYVEQNHDLRQALDQYEALFYELTGQRSPRPVLSPIPVEPTRDSR
ncbi:MAG TPA: WcaI family glycosyltransferase [Synechococcales cyanobacterium M55_K2018_004]|nr:WcaI family glycosyltransferase [Synechococcales cyanobacterium M55_K2018_004]